MFVEKGFVCLFVCYNKTRKTNSSSCDWGGSKPPGSGHTRTEAQTATCMPKTAAQTMWLSRAFWRANWHCKLGNFSRMFHHDFPTFSVDIVCWSELSPPKPNSSGPVRDHLTGAYLASAAKARSNKITLRGHAWDGASDDGSPWPDQVILDRTGALENVFHFYKLLSDSFAYFKRYSGFTIQTGISRNLTVLKYSVFQKGFNISVNVDRIYYLIRAVNSPRNRLDFEILAPKIKMSAPKFKCLMPNSQNVALNSNIADEIQINKICTTKNLRFEWGKLPTQLIWPSIPPIGVGVLVHHFFYKNGGLVHHFF